MTAAIPLAIALLLGLTATPPAARAQSTATPLDMSADAARPAKTRLEKEITTLMRLWPGDYDNREQVQIDVDMGRKTEADGAHLRAHAAVRAVDLPRVGAHVLYVEDYRQDDPAKVFRHGLYELAPDADGKGLRARMWGFKDGAKWWGAAREPARLSTLTRDDLVPATGCDLILRRDGDAFVGGTDPKTCLTDKDRALDFQVQVMADHVLFRERLLDPTSGAVKAAIGGFAWHRLLRARFFSCMIDPPRAMSRAAPDAPGADGYVVAIHDQGGTFTFPYPDGRTIFLSLRNTWSYNMSRKTLVVTLQETDENGAGLGYAWSEPGADRIGFNPLWIHIQCDLETPENLELQRAMRGVL